ncbi:hypothetical protein [Hubei virga-like virus 16]|uniref:hypothetical protein n=1 Tax=Hubei virga-like virus 16 TaxID=1923331 RepID=UPI00090A9192|nr:hypothetical protein [Hubei virga-like virus 16]APG77525.1 hypothetical protein [Hubei virga-like virus 16]
MSTTPPNTVGGFFDDLLKVFLRVFANPVTLILFVVGTLEFISLLTESKRNVYEFLIQNFQELLADNPPKFLISVINSFINLFKYFLIHRRFFLPVYFILIPLILQEREFLTSLCLLLVITVFRSLSVLQIFCICIVWISYNSFSQYHRFVLVFLICLFLYFDMFSSLQETSALYKALQQVFV